MRCALLTTLLLLPAMPAMAQDTPEAREAYMRCFHDTSTQMMPNWCHDPEKLADFSHQGCLREAMQITRSTDPKRAQGLLGSIHLDAKLVMLEQMRQYNAAGNCTR